MENNPMVFVAAHIRIAISLIVFIILSIITWMLGQHFLNGYALHSRHLELARRLLADGGPKTVIARRLKSCTLVSDWARGTVTLLRTSAGFFEGMGGECGGCLPGSLRCSVWL
jgi:hypothetical protein